MINHQSSSIQHRRQLLKFLLGSPLISLGVGACSASSQDQRVVTQSTDSKDILLIKNPEEAINVFDFQKVAQDKLPPAHYGYMATGVLDDRTLIENEKAFERIKLRMRRLYEGNGTDMTVKLFGKTWPSPIIICPCGSQKAFHPEGEIATAYAAKSQNNLMMLSTVATTSIEEVNRTTGWPAWYQLYPSANWDETLSIIKRAEAAGCEVLVLTVDMDHADKRETLSKMILTDERMCKSCHGMTDQELIKNKPMINKLEDYRFHPGMSWEYVDRIKSATKMKLVLKGIVAGPDATIAMDYGVDGIVVSNHGGRATESGRATIDSLPEVVAAVDGRAPVILDSGIRRGGDIFKALALGATAVGIGRPYLWGLGAFGQPGVEMVLQILKDELELVMKQTGVSNLAEISKSQLI